MQLTRLGRIRERTAAQMRSADGVEPAAYVVLSKLLSEGPMRSGALAEAVHSDASTVSRQVAQLVERGLVRRAADPADGRASVLEVTEHGRAIAARIGERRRHNLSLVTADWPERDRAAFAELLTRFVDDYERVRPSMISLFRGPNGTESDS
ncbi:MarR family transcriptional regulator [Nocardia puris]|nr:MarR family transcriptional regulator [Nocardia puris]MBF6366017.1 MarR family transcriptional regulator [Nocardia puris]MBF6460340.1 MarR family transcriptional regulator [Nocardia puris]